MKPKVVRIVVKPRTRWSSFPIDMLRYDRCWPVSERDSYKIVTSETRSHDESGNEVTVEKWQINDKPWTLARWESFGWELVRAERPEV
jgi:hypothetical protein